MSDISQDVVDETYQERIKNLEQIKSFERKYMTKKIPRKERLVRWLIKRWLPDHHLSHNPVKKIKEEKCLCDEPFGDGRVDSSYCSIHNKDDRPTLIINEK